MMKVNVERKATVIIPTIGSKYLLQAVNSVLEQSYQNTDLLVVVDGPEYENQVKDILDFLPYSKITVTPQNTGANGYYGHRIYAAYPHLIDTDYILFLDEDNWYDPNHVNSLVNLFPEPSVYSPELAFTYSFRKIYSQEGEFIDNDFCESLGKWPIFHSHDSFLIDTSSFCFRRTFLIQSCHFWHYGWGGDRRYLEAVKRAFSDYLHFEPSLQATLNYRLDGQMEKKYGSRDFFKVGNQQIQQKYGGYPWKTNHQQFGFTT